MLLLLLYIIMHNFGCVEFQVLLNIQIEMLGKLLDIWVWSSNEWSELQIKLEANNVQVVIEIMGMNQIAP